MKTLFQTIVFSLLILPFTGVSQTGKKNAPAFQNHAYNPQTVISIEGKITEIQLVEHKNNNGQGTHIKVQAGTTAYTVLLGPSWFLDKQKIKLKTGDQIAVTGSKVSTDNLIIAETITSDGKTTTLRDKNGRPEWAGRQK